MEAFLIICFRAIFFIFFIYRKKNQSFIKKVLDYPNYLGYIIYKSSNEAAQQHGEDKMETLSIEAKEIINDLFENMHTPFEIKAAMEDGAYLKNAGISKELSEEIHSFLSGTHIYEAIIDFYDEDDNVIKSAEVIGCNEKEINDIIEKSIAEERDPSIVYGKIKNFCALK